MPDRTQQPHRTPQRRGVRLSSPQLISLMLLLTAAVLTVLLVLTGKLTLYVHPRYTLFTLLMGIAALALLTGAALATGGQHPHPGQHPGCDRDSDHCDAEGCAAGGCDGDRGCGSSNTGGHSTAAESRRRTWAWLPLVPALALLVPLLLWPATSLSAERAEHALTGSVSGGGGDSGGGSGQAPEAATVDADQHLGYWATKLADGATAADLAGQSAEILGFVNPTASPDLLLLSRYSVTCCVVDAQPLSVPVYLPGWQSSYSSGDWLHAEGFFVANPDAAAVEHTVLNPDAVRPVGPPANPYLPAETGL